MKAAEMSARKVILVVVAGGASRRFGGDKLLVELAGKPVLVHSLERLSPAAERVVLVVPAGREEEFLRVVRRYLPEMRLTCVPGGAQRPESVRRGVAAAAADDDDLVAVHDAARPLASPRLLAELCREAARTGGAVPGFPQADALKRVDASGVVAEDVPRAGVWSVGTPQVFRAELLKRACCAPGAEQCVDDAEAVRRIGGRVAVVRCGEPNLKLTEREDLLRLEYFLNRGLD